MNVFRPMYFSVECVLDKVPRVASSIAASATRTARVLEKMGAWYFKTSGQ